MESLINIPVFETGQLRDYSSLFSGQICETALRTKSVSCIEKVFHKYDTHLGDNLNVWDYLKYTYQILEREYKNEYVFKNTFLNTILLEHYALESTVVFNEFRVGDAIADLVLMNGISKAFEIKSELDSDARLMKQLKEYQLLFDECYVVIPKMQYNHYRSKIDCRVGIIVFEEVNGTYTMTQKRMAKRNRIVDVDILMRSVRCEEYKSMVYDAYGKLPNVNSFDMYEACRDKLKRMSSKRLHLLFLDTLKRRKSMTQLLPRFPKETRQMFLSTALSETQIQELDSLYNNILSI